MKKSTIIKAAKYTATFVGGAATAVVTGLGGKKVVKIYKNHSDKKDEKKVEEKIEEAVVEAVTTEESKAEEKTESTEDPKKDEKKETEKKTSHHKSSTKKHHSHKKNEKKSDPIEDGVIVVEGSSESTPIKESETTIIDVNPEDVKPVNSTPQMTPEQQMYQQPQLTPEQIAAFQQQQMMQGNPAMQNYVPNFAMPGQEIPQPQA